MTDNKRPSMFNAPDPIAFNELVWEIVRQIPRGKVSTYGQIASMIPPPDGVLPPDFAKLGPRWVGNAMNAVPKHEEESIPWQRVINSKGGISLPAGSDDALKQHRRLIEEGIAFNAKDLVDFDLVAWDGPDTDWLTERGLFAPRSLKSAAAQAAKDDSDGSQLTLF
ncbi:MAG: MGMT family protein [Burkholderiales bacterium]|nr:MGMT family protein [Anaerolineae bacterium]